MWFFLCDAGIGILVIFVGLTQIALPLMFDDKLFWIFRKDGGKIIDFKFRAFLKSAEKQTKPTKNKHD